ncbi:hypothetical protein E8A74_28575 [Polyangium fumosum]|uniref:Uncharacterized protein n=2 Tax=Polyangium fumosum TaxID=889272 RepID=A0A4U1J5S5_9BACT|nr:hypothetical protein E8A74_28575 [Polyangium fumosum]
MEPGNSGWTVDVIDDAANWKRYEVGEDDGYFLLETRGDGDGDPAPIETSTAVFAYGAQLETKDNNSSVKYPSSYIPTTQAQERTREADKLSVIAPPIVAPDGYFHVKIRFAPNYATAETTENEHDLLNINNDNRLFFRFSDRKIVFRINKVELASVELAWIRDQEIQVEAIHSATEQRLIVSAGGTFSGPAQPPVPVNNSFYVLGNGSGAQECADLRYLGFFEPN